MPSGSCTPARQHQPARNLAPPAGLPDRTLPPSPDNNRPDGAGPSAPRGGISFAEWLAERNLDAGSAARDGPARNKGADSGGSIARDSLLAQNRNATLGGSSAQENPAQNRNATLGSSSAQDHPARNKNANPGSSYRVYERNGSIMVYEHEEDDEPTLRKKYVFRGWTIQQHERRLKDLNDLLSQMRRRLDPDGKVMDTMGDPDFRRAIATKTTAAYSANDNIQGFYDFITAHDLVSKDRTGSCPSIAHSSTPEPVAISNDERRIKTMSTTIKIQARRIQEQTEKIAKLEKAAAATSEKQRAGNATVARRRKKPVVRLPAASNYHLTTPSLRPDDPGSLTSNDFSYETRVDPARVQRKAARDDTPCLTSGSPLHDRSASLFPQAALKTDANTAPLGQERRRIDSALQDSRAGSVTSSHYAARASSAEQWDTKQRRPTKPLYSPVPEVEAPMRGASGSTEESVAGSKRARHTLGYEEPGKRSDKANKRIKSGALTPPPPEEIGVAEELGADSPGGVFIVDEGGVDLEMGEASNEKPRTAAAADGANNPTIEGLDEMIARVRSEALSRL